jgi:hypothetical protein
MNVAKIVAKRIAIRIATNVATSVAMNAAILACPALPGEHHPVRLFRKWQENSNAKRQA